MIKKDVYIIGGGASGVMCALEASKKHRVHIIEKNDKLMKKLLLTGNGSCNFANASLFDKNIYKDRYNNDFFIESMDIFSCKDLIDYMASIGVYHLTKVKYDETYIYPYDYSSKSVYYNIIDALNDRNVDIIYNQEVLDIKKDDDKYIITTKDNKYDADIVVVSTGGKSYQKTGSDGKMWDILEAMGHHIISPIPSLCPIYHDNDRLKDLRGIRTVCEVTAIVDGIEKYREYGEVQFNDMSISGIPILNASCKIGKDIVDKKDVKICIDFIYDIKDIYILIKRKDDLSYKYIRDYLCGIVDQKISKIIYDDIGMRDISDKKVSILSDKNIKDIYDGLKHFVIEVDRLSSFDVAQVTKGGVDTKEIDSHTYMSKRYRDMYIIGEAVDVDGICGGYNLSFAFISGVLAGKNIDKM